ncbi:phosphonate ABC transporter, permease protein PhnE [Vibrio parahaemolyticus]|nr:phosphonate ABC transporter, permease protein PhnE [Vibrio parahaemolyticus]EGR2871989.1 phosphonate ABC transporter, permease protein PhnE [Vibrio parahaemolyticus]EJC7064387.1 phosphonate ABC transporter, permease protein PhnE [Vibrio parahaemolyticus]EJF9995028.1 phosphonate ABC transporter, permease protein PhnE [Vibrio parahaemolyticus]EJG0200062.1 phosphonate ABC transporter, permease protein PhnE [Vibrio parahaemolyticus]
MEQQAITQIKQQNAEVFSQQTRYLRGVALTIALIIGYYFLFFSVYGVSEEQFAMGCEKIGTYFLSMFVWRDFWNWPFEYYFKQIGITLAIVFGGTLTASVVALPLSFLADRNVMTGPFRIAAAFMRRIFDVCRGIDMAIWGMIFVRAVGLGPLAGVMAIFVQDLGLFGKLYAESHEAADKKPSQGMTSVGANNLQKHRFAIFTQSFPSFLALTLYQLESNTRSAAVLGFVGAGGIGLVYAENMRLWNWDVVTFITLVLVVVIMILDKLSSVLRQKYIIGENIPLYNPKA